jgi:hypothetical protein
VDINRGAAAEAKKDLAALENEFQAANGEDTDQRRSTRLATTSIAAQTGQVPEGDNDTREPLQEGTGKDNLRSTARVRIRIPLR